MQSVLLIDTCGETAGVALCMGTQTLAAENFGAGGAFSQSISAQSISAQIVGAVRRLLQQSGWELAELDAVGVVAGPGSFTGVRTGLAAAKGLCEASALRLASVSRLEVLADASGLTEGVAVLDAGRDELYVRDIRSGREWLCANKELEERVSGRIAVAELRIAERLAALKPLLRPLQVADALPVVLRCLASGGRDVVLADANYVRGEQNIYSKAGTNSTPARAQ